VVLRAAAIAGIAVAALLLTGGVAMWVVLNGLTNPVHYDSLAEEIPGTRVNILVLGLDAPLDARLRARPEFDIHTATGSRTDTMMLVSVDPETTQVSVLSLPRDTRTIIAGRENYGYDKLGHAHAYGGPEMIVGTLTRLLNVPIHYYVRINSAGVARIIDLLGGVEIYVEKRMHYVDPYQDLVIDLQPGLQLLDGDKAVQYLRYRSDGSDIDRIERQQKFIRAFKEQLFQLGTISKLPSILDEVVDCVDTNMTAGEMLKYARLAAKLDGVDLETGTLPGEIATITDPGQDPRSYWVIDQDECARVIDLLIWGVDPEANASITVEVRNGTTMPGLAATFAGELERQGYDVIGIGDADTTDFVKTRIIDRSRDRDKLRCVSRAVLRYLPDAQLGRARPDEDGADFTIILGVDYASFVATSDGGQGSLP